MTKGPKKFKIIAKGLKRELLGYLIGRRINSTYIVDTIYYPLQHGSPLWVEALNSFRPRGYIGSIHSHPGHNCDYVTPEDIQTSIKDGDKIFAIFRFDKTCSGVVRWYSLTRLILNIKEF